MICSVEFVGTYRLVFGGYASAVLVAAFPNVAIGLSEISFTFDLPVTE